MSVNPTNNKRSTPVDLNSMDQTTTTTTTTSQALAQPVINQINNDNATIATQPRKFVRVKNRKIKSNSPTSNPTPKTTTPTPNQTVLQSVETLFEKIRNRLESNQTHLFQDSIKCLDTLLDSSILTEQLRDEAEDLRNWVQDEINEEFTKVTNQLKGLLLN